MDFVSWWQRRWTQKLHSPIDNYFQIQRNHPDCFVKIASFWFARLVVVRKHHVWFSPLFKNQSHALQTRLIPNSCCSPRDWSWFRDQSGDHGASVSSRTRRHLYSTSDWMDSGFDQDRSACDTQSDTPPSSEWFQIAGRAARNDKENMLFH